MAACSIRGPPSSGATTTDTTKGRSTPARSHLRQKGDDGLWLAQGGIPVSTTSVQEKRFAILCHFVTSLASTSTDLVMRCWPHCRTRPATLS